MLHIIKVFNAAMCFVQTIPGSEQLPEPEVVIAIMERILDTNMVGKTVGEWLEEFLDMSVSFSEDCLHLAVSTPKIPTAAEVNIFVLTEFKVF